MDYPSPISSFFSYNPYATLWVLAGFALLSGVYVLIWKFSRRYIRTTTSFQHSVLTFYALCIAILVGVPLLALGLVSIVSTIEPVLEFVEHNVQELEQWQYFFKVTYSCDYYHRACIVGYGFLYLTILPLISFIPLAIFEYCAYMLSRWRFFHRKFFRWSLFTLLTLVNLVMFSLLQQALFPLDRWSDLGFTPESSPPRVAEFVTSYPLWSLGAIALFLGLFFVIRKFARRIIRLATSFQYSVFTFYTLSGIVLVGVPLVVGAVMIGFDGFWYDLKIILRPFSYL